MSTYLTRRNTFQDKREEICQLREVRIHNKNREKPTALYNTGKVRLNKLTEPLTKYLQEYEVKDDSKTLGASQKFPICMCNTTIFEDKIEIGILDRFIEIFAIDGTFKVIEIGKFFPLDDFSVSI